MVGLALGLGGWVTRKSTRAFWLPLLFRLTGLLFGLAPSISSTGGDMAQRVKDQAPLFESPAAGVLVAAQMALSLVA
jgi:hypothetical protein